MNAFEHGFARRVLGTVYQDKISRLADFNYTGIKLAHSGGVTSGKAKSNLWRNIAKARQHRNHPQNAKRLHA